MDPDLPLIEALQANDDSALSELINRHREPLFHFVFRYLRDETTARDVVQETFTRAYFRATSFRPRATVKTWLYSIALNLCRDQIRRLLKRRREQPLDSSPVDDFPTPALTDAGPPPDVQMTRKDRYTYLQRAIDQLPLDMREALILFSLEGKTQKEAADILRTTPKSIETRVYHAKSKLRQWLLPFMDERGGPTG